MTTLALNNPLTYGLQELLAQEESSERNDYQTWNFFGNATGSNTNLKPLQHDGSGVNEWLAKIIHPAEDNIAETALDIPEALSIIKDTFSLNTVEMGSVFGVSRQAIYDWIGGKTVKAENRERIRMLLEVANEWKAIDSKPIGSLVRESISDQSSLLQLLSAQTLDSCLISESLEQIAAYLGKLEEKRLPTARELVEKHGFQKLSEENYRKNIQLIHLRSGRGR